jgi:membrane-associated phospholipid phosphatase
MLHSIWQFVTDFGDSAVTIPIAVTTFGFLLWIRWRSAAAGWALAIAGCGVAIGLLKLGFQACDRHLLNIELNPSGHTAMSTTVYSSLAILIGSTMSIRGRLLLVVGTLALLGAIAISRITLEFHNGLDIATGLLVGLTATAVFGLGFVPCNVRPFRLGAFVALLGVLVALLHGTQWPIEHIVYHLVRLIKTAAPECR